MANNNKFAFSQPYNKIILNENLSLAAKVIYCVLKIHENKETHDCYPSVKTLAKEAGMSENTVRKAITDLEKLGIIKIKRRKISKKEWESNLYLMKDLDFIKEKGLESEPAKAQNQAQLNNQSNYIADNAKSQELERYTMREIKDHFDYKAMINDRADEKESIDSVINVIYDVLNTSKKTIRINAENKPTNVVIGKLMKLNYSEIMYCIDKFSDKTERIENPTAYMLTLLYNAKQRMHLDITNQVQHDMHK